MSFDSKFSIMQKNIDLNLKAMIDKQCIADEEYYKFLSYAVLSGGKRLRPILAISTYEMLGGNASDIMPFALSLELIHNYSLVHDDLPCMDNDDYRRGRLTVHKKFGENMAVLTGDALLNLAYEIIAKSFLDNVNLSNKAKAFFCLAKFSGMHGMIGGQFIDVSGNIDSYMSLEEVYSKKTAALIQASVLVPAYLIGVEKAEEEAMYKFGYHLGMAFQLQDDLLDMESGNELNAVLFLSKDKCMQKMEKHTLLALEALKSFENREVSFLNDLTKILVNRKF